jgi:hypothetical protein
MAAGPGIDVFLYDHTTQTNTLISHINGMALNEGNGSSNQPVISHDGSALAFVSLATDLVPGQVAGTHTNVFVYQIASNHLLLASGVQGSGATPGNGNSDSPAISGDGKWVAYRSLASNLVAGQTTSAASAVSNIFEFNVAAPAQLLVSAKVGATSTTANGESLAPVIDDDGHLVSYLSAAGNLVPNQSGPTNALNPIHNVFLWDRLLSANILASGKGGSFSITGNGDSTTVVISRHSSPSLSSPATDLVSAGGANSNAYFNTLVSIGFAPQALPDGSPSGTSVGTLSYAGPPLAGQDGGATYSFVAGAGAIDNASFAFGPGPVQGQMNLDTQFVASYAAKNAYSVRVQLDVGFGDPGVSAFPVNVSPPNTVATTTTLAAQPATANQGQPVTFTATVSSLNGIPTGLVQFEDAGGVPLGGIGPVNLINGSGSLVLTNLGVGNHFVTAVYIPGAGFQSSTSSTVVETVNQNVIKSHPITTIAEFDNTGDINPFAATWYLRSSDSSGGADAGQIAYGVVGWKGVLGDWTGKGYQSIGVVDNTGRFDPTGTNWYLRNSNTPGSPDIGPFGYGLPGWVPVVGDWTGTGHTGIGMYDPIGERWYLRSDASAGFADAGDGILFGFPGAIPIVGDWDGSGKTRIGVFDPTTATFYLAKANVQGTSLIAQFAYGLPGWQPITGDWDGDGVTTIGVVDPFANWYIRNNNSAGGPDITPFAYGVGYWAALGGAFAPPPGMVANRPAASTGRLPLAALGADALPILPPVDLSPAGTSPAQTSAVNGIADAAFVLGAPGSPLLALPATANPGAQSASSSGGSEPTKDPLGTMEASLAALDAAFAAGMV